MNGEFSLREFQRRRIRRLYIYMYTYKYNIYENAFSFKLLEEAVIFKSLKYTVPSLARSYVHSGNTLVPIVHTGSIFLSKKGKCPQRCSNVPNAFDHISSDSLGNLSDEEKRMNEGSVSYFYKKNLSSPSRI